MRLYFLTIFLILVSSELINTKNNIIDEVILTVGDEVILLSDVENIRLQMQMNNQNMEADPYCFILKQLIIQKLYLHQAKLDSIDVHGSQISQMAESWINHEIKQIGSKEKMEEDFGKSIGVLLEERKQAIMIQAMQHRLINNIKVTPSDVRNFYKKISQDSLPFIPTTVEIEIITLEPIAASEEIDSIKKRLMKYTELVSFGQREFSTLARLYSEDIESAKNGGELGFICRGDLDPEFAEVAFELNNSKENSKIVKTEYGYHIIQLIEKKGDRINVRHILLKPHLSKNEILKTFCYLDSIRTNILSRETTFEEEVINVSQDKDTRNNKGLMVNYNSQIETERIGTSHFGIGELPPEISKIICEMKVGDISKPFTMINSKKKQVVSIIKLKSRIEGHKANLTNDYYVFKKKLEYEKQNQIFTEWLNKKKQETYICISDDWKNCNF